MRRAVWFGLLLLLWSSRASATIVIPADLRELAHDAKAVARGRVVAVEARWLEGRRGIETLVTLETEAYLKGSLGERVQFRVPGGSLGRFRNVVVGAPRFDVGQRAIVFLGTRGPSVPFILGLNQGVYRLEHTAAGDFVTPPPTVPAAVAPVSRGSQHLAAAPLAEFEARVQRLLEEVP